MRNGIEIQSEMLVVDKELAIKTVEVSELRTKKVKLELEVAEIRQANFAAQIEAQKKAQVEAEATQKKAVAVAAAEADKPDLKIVK